MVRRIFNFAMLVVCSFFCTSIVANAQASEGWHVVENFKYRHLEFFVESKDPSADFVQRLRVKGPGKKEFIVSTPERDGWIRYNTVVGKSAQYSPKNNLVASQYVLGLPSSSKTGASPYFLLFGDPVASAPGRLDLLIVDTSGSVSHVLSKDELHFIDVVDLDGDGRNEIVALPCFHQTQGDDFSTYDPFYVYKIPATGAMARFSLPLTKRYNVKHYAGWAGADCSEELFVQKLSNGKSKIVRKKAK
jgi:hypothetical protein